MRNPPVAFLLSLEYDCVGMREVFHTNDRCTGGERHHENEKDKLQLLQLCLQSVLQVSSLRT